MPRSGTGLTKRIEAYLFLAVLVLYGVNVIQTALAAHGIHDSWTSVRNKLGRWQRAATAFTSINRTRIEVRMDVRPDPMAATIAKTAYMPYAPEIRIRKLPNPWRHWLSRPFLATQKVVPYQAFQKTKPF